MTRLLSFAREWIARLAGAMGMGVHDQDLEEELRLHADLAAKDAHRRGDSADAVRAARIRVGGAAQAAEALRDQRGIPWLADLSRDVRHSVRSLRRAPGFAAVSIITLALGIGANTAVFGIVDGLVLHPFAFPDADQVLVVGASFPKISSDTTFVEVLSPPEYVAIRKAPAFARTAAFDLGNRNISGGDAPERVFTAFMLDDAFAVVGVQPFLGRGFTAEELQPNGPPASIISHRVWTSRFQGDRSIVGKTVRVNGVATTLVGVMPPELLLLGTDLWIPWPGRAELAPQNMRQFSVIARLKSGSSNAAAGADLATIAARIATDHGRDFPEYAGWRLVATPLAAGTLQTVRPVSFLVLGAVALVLLIACANLASLMLARASGRTREFAVRVSLGAGRRRLAQQLLTEVTVLAAVGGTLGFALAWFAVRASNKLIPPDLAGFGLKAAVNGRVALWCALSTIVATALVAIAPVFHAGRLDLNDMLKKDARASSFGRGTRRVRHALIVAEIALAVVLALGAGLLLRTFVNLRRADTGLDMSSVLTMRLTLPQERYRDQAVTAFFEELVRRVEALPLVRSAGMASQFPPMVMFRTRVMVEGAPVPEGSTFPTTRITVVSRNYFAALGVSLLGGRYFDDRERRDTPAVVIVNDAFSSKYLAGRQAIGARIRAGDKPDSVAPAEIVGVVANTANAGPAARPEPEIFVPMEHAHDWNQLYLVARIAGDPMSAVPAIRQAVMSIDRDQPVYFIQTLDQAFAASIVSQRVSTVLLTIFAAVAFALAAVGIFGVTAYSVRSRTREIGIRMAIGSSRGAVLWMVVREVAELSTAGLALGVVAIAALGSLLSSLLFGVQPVDPLTIAVTTLLLAGVAVGAAWWPASFATRIDPVIALRAD